MKLMAKRLAAPGHNSRLVQGGAILEFAIISVLLVLISLFCLDVLTLALGSGLNERACRDAARMAAQATNYADSLVLAQTATKAYKGDGYFIGSPTVDTASFVYNDYGGSPPTDTSPYVQVTTVCQVRIPAPIFVYGLNFSGGNMSFQKVYTFPIITTAQ